MNRRFCDHCGTEIPAKDHYVRVVLQTVDNERRVITRELEICGVCDIEVQRWATRPEVVLT